MSYETYERDAHQLETHQIHIPYAEEAGLIPHDITVNMVMFAGQTPTSLVTMGMGNEGRAPYMAQVNIAEGHGIHNLAYLQGLPYHQVAPYHALRFGVDATRLASKYLADRNGDQPTHLMLDSQATPGGVIAFAENMDAFSRVDPLHPIGFAALSKLAFFYRLGETGMQWDQLRELFGPAGYVGGIALKRGVQDLARGAKRLKVALESDVISEWAEILRARPDDATMHLNDNCRLYPEPEVKASIKKARDIHPMLDADDIQCILDNIRTIPGSHSSPASKAGAAQVANIVSFVRQKEAAETQPTDIED